MEAKEAMRMVLPVPRNGWEVEVEVVSLTQVRLPAQKVADEPSNAALDDHFDSESVITVLRDGNEDDKQVDGYVDLTAETGVEDADLADLAAERLL